MKIDFNRKYNTISAYCIITFAICLALVLICLGFPTISGYIKEFFRVIAPITWGIVIAYICNPIMKFFEKLAVKLFCKKKQRPRLCRNLSVFISMVILIALLSTLVTTVIIQVINSVSEILKNTDVYTERFIMWVEGIGKFLTDKFNISTPEFIKELENLAESIQPRIIEFANNLIPKIGQISLKVKDGAIDFIIALKDFIIGFIVAIYLLISKETFLAQSRKIVYALFPKAVGRNIMQISSKTNASLSGFISGKLLDSLIIGMICFFGMSIMRSAGIMHTDFTVLISVIIGVTNIIPFFGPFFGAIPSALLLLMAAPKDVIPFIIFIVVLQQFDGNILGPKILGDSTGLTPFWVMFAIFVGGGLFGFAGMLLGVPVFAVVYALFSEFIAYLLRKKRLSHRTADYDRPDLTVPPPAVPAHANKEANPSPKASEKEQTEPAGKK